MIARLVKNTDNQIVLLCKDGTIANPSMTVLANFLSNFKDANNFNGNDGSWLDVEYDMALYPGETFAYVSDELRLIISDFAPFEAILSKTYDISSYISLAEYAKKVGKSTEIIKVLCREGRIMGAKKMGGSWMIPEDAPYPVPRARRKRGPKKNFEETV